MKQFYLIILFLSSLQIYSQDNSIMISGVVKNDSTAIEGVHILNLNSKIGTVSNALGNFKLFVNLKDTILFSDIQFDKINVIINETNMYEKHFEVNLQIKINTLPEVIVDHEKNTMGINALTLELPNAGKEPLDQIDRKLNYYSQKSTPMVFLDALILSPILNFIPFVNYQKGGIDDMYNIISGNRKKDRKLKGLLEEDEKIELNLEYIRRIRIHFQDIFFIETLEIPKEKINSFIDHCLSRNIIFLFDRGRTIEIMNIFLNESKNFMTEDQVTHLTKD